MKANIKRKVITFNRFYHLKDCRYESYAISQINLN